jgi:hypothetical protein
MITTRKLVPLPPSPVPDMLYGAIDGTGVTTTAKETADREGKGADGRTREVKLGVFFTQPSISTTAAGRVSAWPSATISRSRPMNPGSRIPGISPVTLRTVVTIGRPLSHIT